MPKPENIESVVEYRLIRLTYIIGEAFDKRDRSDQIPLPLGDEILKAYDNRIATTSK
jgi:hypothetical protein